MTYYIWRKQSKNYAKQDQKAHCPAFGLSLGTSKKFVHSSTQNNCVCLNSNKKQWCFVRFATWLPYIKSFAFGFMKIPALCLKIFLFLSSPLICSLKSKFNL